MNQEHIVEITKIIDNYKMTDNYLNYIFMYNIYIYNIYIMYI